jgi:hypothetical protein
VADQAAERAMALPVLVARAATAEKGSLLLLRFKTKEIFK